MADFFLTLEQLSVLIGGDPVLDGLDWQIHHGEQWALTGPSGSGKTVLAHTILGRHFYTGYIGHGNGPVAMVEQQHRFRSLPGATDLYYQQRFNSMDADQTITVAQELEEYGISWEDQGDDLLHIRPLLSKPLIQLSNGENKRAQLAIALAGNPEFLILDNPFLGLDTEGRETLHRIINTLATAGIHLLLITAPGEIPASITHIARLEKGHWTYNGPRAGFLPTGPSRPDLELDPAILEALTPRQASPNNGGNFSIAVKMMNVTIRYGETLILQHIDWEVKKGEKWNLSGPNGAGKSTILSLITADNPQAYANEIWLFDRKRGSGESIWDIKKKIGFVSPELHLFFEYNATCLEVIASGLFDTIGLFRPLTPEQSARTDLWIRLLSLQEHRSKRLNQLSTGQQRMVLLARALIKNPPLLILDEPCQGLDEGQIDYFRELINTLCLAFNTTLIYVSHYRQELPACIDRFLRLDKGLIVP